MPLGSTTYYFKDKDELILAAMGLIGDRNVTRLRERIESYKARGFGVVEALTALTEELNIRRLDVLVVEYRFYLAPLNRVELHAASVAVQSDWYSILDVYLLEHVDPVTAAALAYAFEGIAIRAVALGEGPPAETIAPIYRRIVQQSAESPRKSSKRRTS